MRETDDCNPVVAFLQDILRKFLADRLCSLNARLTADFALALIRNKRPQIKRAAFRTLLEYAILVFKVFFLNITRLAHAACHGA